MISRSPCPAPPPAVAPIAALLGRVSLAAMLLVAVGRDTAQAAPRPERGSKPVAASQVQPRAAATRSPRAAPARDAAGARRPSVAPRRVAEVPAPAPARPRAAAPPVVVVDAGHGGHDPGAIGPAGTREKAVTLATAQELARQLRATGRYRVLMTRTGDRFVPLDRRVAIAAASGAALLISVHADASTDPRARGASVYVRPARPSGPAVRLPANRGASRAIARALSDPARPERDAARLQLALVDSLNDGLTMLPDPARQARLHVLGALGIPGVLVEAGFISNPREEALLRQPRHRALIARAIRDAVDDYFAGSGGRSAPGGRKTPAGRGGPRT